MKALISVCIIAAIGILLYYHELGGATSGVLLLLIWRKICTWYKKHPVQYKHKKRPKKKKRYFEVKRPWEARFFD